MKLLQVYNDYRSELGGEAGVVAMIGKSVEKHGGQSRLFTRTSKGLDASLGSKVRGFISGIYNRSTRREMADILRTDRPDVVHVHNLYPMISPSVIFACRRAAVPVVMMNHNYLLTCPVVNHLHQGRICEKCLGGREYWCVVNNCRENLAESVAYAARSAVARKTRVFQDSVTLQIVLSDFARQRLIRQGFDAGRVEVLPNMVELAPEHEQRPSGGYVAYSGRMMPEKGVDVLLTAAGRLPELPFRLAGNGPIFEELMRVAPGNAMFMNRLDSKAIKGFYRGARFLVVPSMNFEGCPLVISEAMSQGLAVIASRIGGLPEFVENGVTGLLFEPGNAAELAEKIRLLWENPDLCARFGRAGRLKAEREYSEDVYYRSLMAIYEKATEINSERLSAARPAPNQERPSQIVDIGTH